MKAKLFPILTLLVVLTAAVQAIEFVQRDHFISGEAETLRDEIWISAQSITISGEALDDLFAMGGVLDLRGNFKTDVWAAGGGQVIAAGWFGDHARLLSRTVQVSGTFDNSLTALGTTVKIDRSATIARNLFSLGDHVINEGTIAGNVRIAAKKATLGGKTAGDVSIAAQEIVILPGTIIGGNLNYTAPKELVLSPSVTLGGKLNRTFETPPRQFLKPNLSGHFIFAVAALLTGLVFSSLFPRYAATTLHLLRTARATCLLTGFVALCLIPISAFLLLFTLIGLPLSLLLILFYTILLYLSKIAVGFWLGALLLRRKDISKRNRTGTLAAGLLVIYMLTAFTGISLVINLLVAVAGLGALLLALFKKPVLIFQTPSDIK